ncbi:MAG: ABC-F family ATP-binding cassette domain-containing protein [Patescibacteria group bacterium]|nr:ABC-F family ATP-binding cassette domain-containing protein [Patescibacteria group bacterium]
MTLITANDISKSFGTATVFTALSFDVEHGQRIALVGPNGSGKSTLLKVLAGELMSDTGSVTLLDGLRIGYLPQVFVLESDLTVRNLLKSRTGIEDLEREIDGALDSLDDPAVAARYAEAVAEFERLDGYSFERRMEAVLGGLDLEPRYLDVPYPDLSGGQKCKVALAAILLASPDVLLLDEPTNNLDVPALVWLEGYLTTTTAACLIVSHDRLFLDRVANVIFEIDRKDGGLVVTHGSYSEYVLREQKKRERLLEQYRAQQEEIARLRDRARSMRSKGEQGSRWVGTDNDKFLRGFKRDRAGKSSKGAKTVEKRIDRMEKVERPQEREPLLFSLVAEEAKGRCGIALQAVELGYPGSFRIGPLNLNIKYGDRLGLLGLNGVGKTTLLKGLVGELDPITGIVSRGSGIVFGNLMQEHDGLPEDESPLEYVMERTEADRSIAYATLVHSGLGAAKADSRISELSPGEKARLLLMVYSLMSVNVLILDEPTNHLDLEALAALDEALESYQGTVVLASHDRYFIERTRLDDLYLLEDGALKATDAASYFAQAEERASRMLRLLKK